MNAEEEQKIRAEGFKDGINFNKVFQEIDFINKRFQSYLNLKRPNFLLDEIEGYLVVSKSEIKGLYELILKIDKKYKNITGKPEFQKIRETFPNYEHIEDLKELFMPATELLDEEMKVFDNLHGKLCYLVASSKPWGQE